ncbi:TetR family transcriptional regulator [Dietzia sp. NCCP-2495]|uniref:TetR family transcriptional regulator n=1 Tax=Dietzia sp. NCCP-2495 TaxID=2934675 RepID=UPI00223092ED|nr:TetR/AcrR family transcriptional regulator [Dietzia sp. NCCP-2495]GLB64122.1 TetR family transcriptional regulator [Dietzia sp. NCCP-2495]
MALSKTSVVDTALELLQESGLAGMSMRTLATRIGVQPSALYWHIPSKQALLTAVAERVLATVRSRGGGGSTGGDSAGGGSSAGGGGSASAELRSIGEGLRAAVAGVPDGAEIVALGLAAGAVNPVVAAVEEVCARHGLAERAPGLAAVVTGYVIGLGLEEQTHHNLRVADPELAEIDFGPRFAAGLDALLAGVEGE